MFVLKHLSVCLIIQFSTSLAKKPTLEVIFTRADSYYDADFLGMFKIIIKPSIPGPIIDVNMKVTRNFTENESPITFFNLLKKDASENYRSLFVITFNYCEMFGSDESTKNTLNVKLEHIIRQWVDAIKKYSNLPKCPLVMGDYSIKNLRIGQKIVAAFLSAGNYRIDFQNYLKNKQVKFVLRNATINFIVKRRK